MCPTCDDTQLFNRLDSYLEPSEDHDNFSLTTAVMFVSIFRFAATTKFAKNLVGYAAPPVAQKLVPHRPPRVCGSRKESIAYREVSQETTCKRESESRKIAVPARGKTSASRDCCSQYVCITTTCVGTRALLLWVYIRAVFRTRGRHY